MTQTKDHKYNLLIVEDDNLSQTSMSILLKRYYNIDICDSAETFYEKLKEKKFDLFIVDMSIRGTKDGLQLTRELREDDYYKNHPIICLTAHVFKKDQKNALEAGVDVFFPKPTDNKVLIEKINELLNK